MQNKNFRKILSIFSAAALLVTQLAVTLPASAENEEVASPFPGTTLIHDVSFDSGETIMVNKTDMNDTDATAVVTTEENAGADGSKAIKVVMSNPTSGDKRAVIWPGSCIMGNGSLFEKDVHHKYIVQFKYKVDAGSSVIMEIGSGCANETSTDCGWLGVIGKEFMTQEDGDITKPGDWNLLYSPIYNEWTTVSLPLDMVAGSEKNWQTFAISLKQNAGKTATIYFDDIKLYRVDDQSANLGLVCFTTNGGKTLNPVGGVVGTEYTMPTPVKEGYEFAGWYTDKALTTPYDGKFPVNSAKGGHGESLVYTPLYAKWTFDPFVAISDDFERDDVEGRVVQVLNGNDKYDGTSNPIYQDTEGVGVDGKGLLYFKDFAGRINANVILKNSDGSTFSVNSGEELNLIVKFSYKTTDDDFPWGTNAYICPMVISDTEGSYQFTKLNSIILSESWGSFDFSTYRGYKTGTWNTVSYPVKGTVDNDGLLSLGIETASTGTLFIDNVEITVLPSDMSSTAMVMTDSMTSTVNKNFVTEIAGSDISVLPKPVKDGYKFTGWYSDAECTQKLTTVPRLADGAKYTQIYSGWEYITVFTDDFENRDTLITEATGGVSIQNGKGKNGGKALVFDLANKSGTMNYIPQNADGARLLIKANESYKFIVTMTYRMTAGNNEFAPVWMKSQLVNSSNGWLNGFAANFHLGDVIWPNRVPYSTELGGYCGPTSDGEWHTVSFPISGTGHSSTNGYLVHYFDGLGNIGEFIIDDITYTLVDAEVSTVKFVTNGGSELDYTTVVTGASTSELPTPSKAGYEFAGWYTDEACTVKCDAVPSNNQSQTENGNTTENVYVNLYAKWSAASFDANNDGTVNVIDLISMKKSIANNEAKYNSDNLVDLRKVLLGNVNTKVTTDKNSYVLTLHDEFDGAALNTDLWNITGDKDDVTLENGLAVFGKNGTAGSIDSAYKVQYKYGYVEARVKLPETSGVESAFWLNQNYAPTLRFSEIDIFETFGRSQVVSNIHKWDNNNKKDSYATTEEELAFHTDWNANVLTLEDQHARIKSVDTSAFHTVGCEWGEDFVRFYLDGEKYFEVNAEKYPDAIEIIKASPLYIVLSANPESATLANSDKDLLQVDYVRLYQNPAESTLIK